MVNEEEYRLAGALEYFKSRLAHETALSAALVSFMQTAIRSAFLLNGGAIIAAVSVYGALNSKITMAMAEQFSVAVRAWAIGLVLATVAVLIIGFAQRQFQTLIGASLTNQAINEFNVDASAPRERNACLGHYLRWAATVVWILSIAAFGCGVYQLTQEAFVGVG